jgi:hypothetical protein
MSNAYYILKDRKIELKLEWISVMNKGKVFISSTVYDFQDLRSALKYWLTEMGYEVYMSECNDFPRNAGENSYQTCLSTIKKCDWFILLIGNRFGGTFLDPDTNQQISITQGEYRIAYRLFVEGKVKKIITFVRKNIWIAKEERNSISKGTGNKDVIQLIRTAPSPNADMPLEIFAFIDEVRRAKEMAQANAGSIPYPKGNWVNTFDSFSDMVDTLRVELCISKSISSLVWAANISDEIKQNLKKLAVKNSRGYFGMFARVTSIRDKCISQLKANGKFGVQLSISECKVITGAFISAITLRAYVLKESLLAGQFLYFNPITNKYEPSVLSKNLSQLVDLIENNNLQKDYFDEARSRIFEKTDQYRGSNNVELTIEYTKIAPILAEHDQLSNILTLSIYALSQIYSGKEIPTPSLYPNRLFENFEIPENKKMLYDSYDEFYGKELTDADINNWVAELEGGKN